MPRRNPLEAYMTTAQPQNGTTAPPQERTDAEPPKRKSISRGVSADLRLLDACKLLAVKQHRHLKDVFNEACRDVLRKYGEPVPETEGE